MAQKGYVLRSLSDRDLLLKRRCEKCGVSCKNGNLLPENVDPHANEVILLPNTKAPSSAPKPHTAPPEVKFNEVKSLRDIRCRFHPGHYSSASRGKPKQWTCCGQTNGAKVASPCRGCKWHVPKSTSLAELRKKFGYRATPQLPNDGRAESIAVAIDCEMGTSVEGDSELIRVTVIDYFTAARLLDTLVYPAVPMAHFNTRFSGVTRKDMESARREKRCIMGRERARAAVWKHVGPATIVIGHAANNDLAALRWIHMQVIDTLLIAQQITNETVSQTQEDEAAEEMRAYDNDEDDEEREGGQKKGKGPNDVTEDMINSLVRDIGLGADRGPAPAPKKHAKGEGPHTLKTLCRVHLGREIQSKQSRGHDSFEDALAARDLAHFFVSSKLARGDVVGKAQPMSAQAVAQI
ncbi:hypothetical protein EJ05DRAFT_540827 [Pseudovirgaria hyperparasitica]|uniref:Exonuclease domain-containing protein n=1 Tax=Pseudovirgaria hyperparasitica TaxID=470096 RepID=A0A6A6VX50_9PEZI|nr:uncharacterized protein EJ05DRAFT_540827 [Pseudovirgaria hyperparasitica]KAF2754755.1 hypothetical protein EJ05DRAFT_540827 [Pseudovirgaria hyperparasitica]